MPVKTACLFSAFVSVCRWLLLNLQEMCWELKNAHSTEMNPDTPDPVIDLMEEQKEDYGERRNYAVGLLSMRDLLPDTLAYEYLWYVINKRTSPAPLGI